MFKRLFTREHASRRVMGHFIRLLCNRSFYLVPSLGVLRPKHLQMLRLFHHWAARYICKNHIQPANDGTEQWVYPKNETVLADAGLFDIEVYIQRRRDTIHAFVKDR